MNTLLGLVLAVPLVGAVLVVVAPGLRSAATVRTVAAAVALGWAVLAAAEHPAGLGRLLAEPVTAAAVAGFALLVAARPPASLIARSASLTAITLLGAAATSVDRASPERAFAAGVAVLTVVAVLRARSEGRGLMAVVPLVAGGAATVAGLLVDDPDRGLLLVLGGAVGVLVAAVLVDPSAVVLGPVVLLALVRVSGDVHETIPDPDGSMVPGAAGAVVGLLVAAALLRSRRRLPERLALAALGAAAVAIAQDLPELRTAGPLIAAGGVLALVGRHPVALVATLPGLAAIVDAFGLATEPAQAAAGAAVVALVLAAVTEGRPAPAGAPARSRALGWPVAPAVAFGVLPAWGWADASPGPYTEGVVTAAAFGVPALVALIGWPHRPVTGRERDRVGRMRFRRGRSSAAPDGSTQATAEDEGAGEEVGVEAGAQPAASS